MKFEFIHAENYASYKTLDLNLAGLGRIFSVSGHNGAGKTTMFKSLVVLLYETTPTEGKGIARFVRKVSAWDKPEQPEGRGKKALPVLKMEGILTQGTWRYRIVRTFDPNVKQGGHMLSLQRRPIAAEAGEWDVITGQTIGDTQAEIEQLFGNYRSFMTSTFMSHGASGFLDATDEDREDIAAYIFGCEGYDKRLQLATEKRLALERTMDADTARLKELSQATAGQESIRVEIANMQKQEADLQAAIKELEQNIEKGRSTRDEVQKNMVVAEVAQKAVTEIQDRIDSLRAKEIELLDLIENGATIKEQAATLATARETIRDQQERYSQASEIQRKIDKLNALIIQEENALKLKHSAAKERYLEAETAAKREAEYVEKAGEIDQQLQALADTASIVESINTQIAEIMNKEGDIRAQVTAKRARMEELRENIRAIAAAGSCCPTCERAFKDDADRQAAIDKFNAEGKELKAAAEDLQRQAQDIAERKQVYGNNLRTAQIAERRHQELTVELARVDQQVKQAAEASRELNELNTEKMLIEGHLVTMDFSVNEREQITALELQLKETGYDQAAYNKALQDERALAKFEQAAARLERADNDLQDIRTKGTAEMNARIEKEKTANDYPRFIQQRNALDDEIATNLKEGAKLMSEAQLLAAARITAQTALVRAQDAEKEAQAIKKATKDALKAVAVYRVLETAFRPAGIPKMKYDRYLPTLTNKVNYALGIITSGWEVKITSQLTARGKFTIPIMTADPKGIELQYGARSNGEKFILALSFLIGIALFWGERTGAQPQHVMVDEGFDTLDPSNLEKGKAAMSAIALNFGQVGIISHLPEMVSIGQVQLQVYNDPKDGSKFEMLGTGERPPRVGKTFLFSPEQLSAVQAGIDVIKDEIPGMNDSRAVEAAVASTAQGVQGGKKTKPRGARK